MEYTGTNNEMEHEIVFVDGWDAPSVRTLFENRCASGSCPTHLLLGRTEMALLKDHLSKVFGEDSIASTTDLYYMGMAVTEMTSYESMLSFSGKKSVSIMTGYGNPLSSGNFKRIA